jgi:hypothetical protein
MEDGLEHAMKIDQITRFRNKFDVAATTRRNSP